MPSVTQLLLPRTLPHVTPLFSVSLPSTATTSPIIAGNVLYFGASNARVYGVSTNTGQEVWSAKLPSVPGGGGGQTPFSDIGIGHHLLIVPAGNTVTAFG